MKVKLSLYENSRAFLEQVGDALYSRETINNLILGVSERLVNNPEAYKNPFFAVVNDESGEILLAAVMTPPHNLILAGSNDFEKGLPTLIAYLQKNKVDIPGVIGPAHISETFAKIWKRGMKEVGTIKMHQRVYELRAVHMPSLPEGQFRIAFSKDAQRIAQWLQAFSEEALAKDAKSLIEEAKTLISDGKIFVWEEDGEILSMAQMTRPIAHSITITCVYTPPQHRRKGYATALVARLSQHLLDLGYKFVNLFTDLENPTSNSIYQKIGYHPVCDFRMYSFKRENC